MTSNQDISELVIANQDAREKFSLTRDGVLYSVVALDREKQEQHMLTIVVGRRGLLRGKHVIQLKVHFNTVINTNECVGPKLAGGHASGRMALTFEQRTNYRNIKL